MSCFEQHSAFNTSARTALFQNQETVAHVFVYGRRNAGVRNSTVILAIYPGLSMIGKFLT